MNKRTLVLGAVLLLTAILPGCGEPSTTYDDSAATEPATEAAMPASFEMTEELGAKLAAADRADGEEDKVVSKCPGCSLAMDGSHEHAFPAGEYSLHFCSDSCKDRFTDDLEQSVIALAVPQE